jgi:Sigma-70, region 4
VLAAVSSLPDRQRDAIVMRELEGRSYDEIASRLGASHGAVRQLLNRARGSVRDRIRALVPVEPVVRWVLSQSNGANAVGGATLSGACVLGAKVCVVALLPATVALGPSPSAPRHEAVTRKARPATHRIHGRTPATRSATAPRVTNATVAVRLIFSRGSTPPDPRPYPFSAGGRLGAKALTPARARHARHASPAKENRSPHCTSATHPTERGLPRTDPPDTPTDPQPPAASSDAQAVRTLGQEHPPAVSSHPHPVGIPGPAPATQTPGPTQPGQSPRAPHPMGERGPTHAEPAQGPGATYPAGAPGPTHSALPSGTPHSAGAPGPTHSAQPGGTTHPAGASDSGHWAQSGGSTHPAGQPGPTHSAQPSGTPHPAGAPDPTHSAQPGDATHPAGSPSPTHLAGGAGAPGLEGSGGQRTSLAPQTGQPVRPTRVNLAGRADSSGPGASATSTSAGARPTPSASTGSAGSGGQAGRVHDGPAGQPPM